jgi:hypothetical protein
VIATHGRVEDADLEAFKVSGFSDQAALEVVLGVSLATLCNFANNLGRVPLNPQFEPYRWDGVSTGGGGMSAQSETELADLLNTNTLSL